MRIILLVIPACLLALSAARRVQVRPRVTEPQVYYEDEDSQAIEDDYTPTAYQPRTRALPSPRSKDTSQSAKAPPVQTIRNYNKVNDDGSFTFGYEAADGSFKEETRGVDCVVRGKYGYIDPDGNKREFTYVSGNPCDPNAPREEDDDVPQKQEAEDTAGPANYPSVRPVARPIRPTYAPTTTRAPTTLFQTQFELDDDASQELEDVRPQHRPTPPAYQRPQRPSYVQPTATPSAALYQPAPATNPTVHRSTTAAPPQYQTPALYRTQPTPSPALYRPVESSTRAAIQARPQSIAITPRPHVVQVAAQYAPPRQTERPGVVFASRSIPSALRTTTASTPSLDFASELQRYVNTVGVTPRPTSAPVSSRVKATPTTDPIYQSELVYDPATGQYNTQLYQTLPQTVGDFSLSHKLQPFVAQPQSLLSLDQLQQQSPLYRQPASAQSAPAAVVSPQPQQAIFRQQQAALFQQSQQLYAQQQRRQNQQQPQRFQLLDSQKDAQPFYYVSAPQSEGASAAALSAGQIDQFLRGASGSF